jgi:hypothetical protein
VRIYYNGPDALVTEEIFVWRSDPLKAFAITDLRDVRLVQRDVGSPRTIVALAGVAASAMIVAPGWLFLHQMAGRLILLAAAMIAVTLASLRRRSVHQWELRAAYRAREVTIYTTLEIRTFNQVTRALRRAVEGRAPGRRPRMAAA